MKRTIKMLSISLALSIIAITADADAQTTPGNCAKESTCAMQPGALYSYNADAPGQPGKSVPAPDAASPAVVPSLKPQPLQPKPPAGPLNPLPKPAPATRPVASPAVPRPSVKTQASISAPSGSHGGILLPSTTYDQKKTPEAEAPTVVVPEVATQAVVSNSDVNRIVCQSGDIKDVVFSKEKGLSVKISGRNAFLKFHIFRKEGEEGEIYITTPSELFIVCGPNIYNVIAIPKRIPSRTISLAEGRMESIRKNAAIFGSLPLEKKVISLIKKTYRGEAASDFLVTKVVKRFDGIYQDADITLQKIVTVEGEGLRLKEYTVRVKPDAKVDSLYIKEKDFLRPDFASRAVAVAVDPVDLKKGETARAFVVELAGEVER